MSICLVLQKLLLETSQSQLVITANLASCLQIKELKAGTMFEVILICVKCLTKKMGSWPYHIPNISLLANSTSLWSLQERIAKAHGSQCGFCTPGMVMSMYTLLRNSTLPSQREMENAFQGNA